MRASGRLLLISIAVVLVGSCAITSGSTFSRVVEAEATVSAPQSGTGTETEPLPVLSIRTEPDDASVWLDNAFLGSTPLSLDELDPGTYRLRIEKNGYYPVRRWIEIPENSTLALEIDLEQITGYLSVESQPQGADILVDGDAISAGFAELPVGSHRVRVRLFGYVEESFSVDVSENAVTRVRVELETAPFGLGRVSASRTRFNPANPGATGFVRLTFQVSAPGDGSFNVHDSRGTLIQTIHLAPFTTWDQTVEWPKDFHGSQPEDGLYSLELDLHGADGRSASSGITVEIDSSLVIRYRSFWHGAPGLLYAVAPQPLPPGNVQVSVQLAGIITELDYSSVARFPVKIGTRIGLGANAEIALYGSLLANSAPLLDRWGAGAAVSWIPLMLTRDPFTLVSGLIAGGAYRTPNSEGVYTGSDTLTDFPGFFLSVPVLVSAGPIS
ncbi:MAG: PEGA domain-containing protein, partial [Spirochaetaceae bacterium]|nr:PEGA domain-containing protein [Spirochaetaceae bacterium]